MVSFDKQLLMEVYAKVLQGKISRSQKLITGEMNVPVALVAESMDQLRYYLCQALRNKKFIPICVGVPGSPEQITDSLEKHGAYIGHDIPNRDSILKNIGEIKDACRPVVSLDKLYV